jgi:hypothetical protein
VIDKGCGSEHRAADLVDRVLFAERTLAVPDLDILRVHEKVPDQLAISLTGGATLVVSGQILPHMPSRVSLRGQSSMNEPKLFV